MLKERIITVFGLVMNTMIIIIRVFSGITFGSYTLMVSGYYALSDLCTEFLAFSSSVARGRRASQKNPFGFGKIESLCFCFFAITLMLIALFVFGKSFFLTYKVTNIKVLLVILFLIVFKFLSSGYIFEFAKDIQSQMIMECSYNAYKDMLISIFVLFVAFVSSFVEEVDMVGAITVSLFIMCKGIDMIVDNYLLIKGQNDNAKGVIGKIKKIVNEDKRIQYSNCNLINVKSFYKAEVEILIDQDVSIFALKWWQLKMRKEIITSIRNIKMVDFIVYEK